MHEVIMNNRANIYITNGNLKSQKEALIAEKKKQKKHMMLLSILSRKRILKLALDLFICSAQAKSKEKFRCRERDVKTNSLKRKKFY